MAADKPSKSKKRLVKNPETFRERAEKATQASDKPKRADRLKQGGSKAAQPVVGPVRRGFRALFQIQPFKFIGKILKLIGKIILPTYIRNSWAELRLVTWPGRRESRRLTSAVLIFAIIFGASIALVDYGLDKVFKNILLK